MRTVTVNVTQEDIDSGERGDTCGCPVALAIKRATGIKGLTVGHAAVYYTGGASPLPVEVGDFIVAFDAGRPVRPIAFTLRVPVTTEAK